MREMKDSGIEWIGEIPKDWDLYIVKHLFKIGRGRVISELELDDDGVYPVYSSQTKNDGCMGYLNTYDFNVSQLTWTTDGVYAGTVFIRYGKHNCTNVCGTLQPYKNEENDLRFLKYALEYVATNHRRKDINGGKIMNNEMARIKIPVPVKFMQQRIADFLDTKCDEIDSLTKDIQEQIETLEEYKKSVITEAVTKGLSPKVEMKTSNVEWIDKIPKHWAVNKIKYLFTTTKGLSITKENLIDEGLPVVSYGQIHSKLNTGVNINEELIRFVSFDYEHRYPRCNVKKYDFIFADTSEDYDGCGNCVYKRNDDLLFGGYHSIILHSMSKHDNRYLAYLFLTDSWRKQIREKASGVKVFSITQKNLNNASIILPPRGEQQQIADYLDSKCSEIDTIIQTKKEQLDVLAEYKKSLIYEYVTGKKEVK